MLHARRIPRRLFSGDKMTQMTQSREFPWAPDLRAWVIWVTQKTMTQMTQMTQSRPAGPLAGASLQHAARWPPAGPPPAMPANTHNAKRGGAGPAAKGRQKRTDREQFFFSYKFFFLVE